MRDIIVFALSNFTLTLLVIGLIFSGIGIARASSPLKGPIVVEKLFFWFIFFSIGVAYCYNGVVHIVGHEMAAALIGWADSPFQIELGFASLGIGLVGLIAPWKSIHMRFAVIVPTACFLWGAAGVHVHSMITEGNFAPGNAGVIFWTDIIVPIIGLFFLWLQRGYEKEGRSAAPYPNLAASTQPGLPMASHRG
ncbi:MAG TPA: DUF6790 family protein [Rhizobiaceae bacterium]|nr:DUF6790 family protein [Rhizobiaceae bacterium]